MHIGFRASVGAFLLALIVASSSFLAACSDKGASSPPSADAAPSISGITTTSPSVTPAAVSLSPLTPLENVDLSIAVATDTHIRTKENTASATLIEQILYSREVSTALGDEMVALAPDALILCGDLADNGRKTEHEQVVEILNPVKDQGIPTLVLPGNHDLSSTSREEFAELYASFGYDDALSRDERSCSYVYALSDEVWALMLDTNLWPETAGEYEGELLDSTLAWIEETLRSAQDEGVMVLSFSHHNLTELLGEGASGTIKGADRLAALYCEYGVKLNVCGHRHAYQVSTCEVQKGSFCEVLEPMMADHPNAYGWITLDASSGQINHEQKTIDVSAWAARNNVEDEVILNFNDHSLEWSNARNAQTVNYILSSLDAPEDETRSIEEFLSQIMSASSAGTLTSVKQELLESEGYRLWCRYGKDSNYYLWFEQLLAQTNPIEGDFSLS